MILRRKLGWVSVSILIPSASQAPAEWLVSEPICNLEEGEIVPRPILPLDEMVIFGELMELMPTPPVVKMSS